MRRNAKARTITDDEVCYCRDPLQRLVQLHAPVVDGHGQERGVVAEGPVGARWAGRFRIFRYEMRRWRDGVIPDIGEAVDSPRRLSNDLADARRLLELVPQIPTLVWGRDERPRSGTSGAGSGSP